VIRLRTQALHANSREFWLFSRATTAIDSDLRMAKTFPPYPSLAGKMSEKYSAHMRAKQNSKVWA